MSWQSDLRDGLAPLLSDDTLRALLAQAENGGERLIRTEFVKPMPTFGVFEPEPWQAGCLIGYCAAVEFRCLTNNDVSRMASDLAHRVVDRLEPDRHIAKPPFEYELMRWWDSTPHEQALPLLAAEVRAILEERSTEHNSDALLGLKTRSFLGYA